MKCGRLCPRICMVYQHIKSACNFCLTNAQGLLTNVIVEMYMSVLIMYFPS